jgi:hypothetical protein
MWNSWIREAGGSVPTDAFVEISSLVSVDGRGLEKYVKGKVFKNLDLIEI